MLVSVELVKQFICMCILWNEDDIQYECCSVVFLSTSRVTLDDLGIYNKVSSLYFDVPVHVF